MLLRPLGAEESAFVPTVHPFWVLVGIVNFLLLLYFMRRLLWGPVTTMLEDRARRIREGLAAAEAARTERERMKVEADRVLADARQQASEIAERTTQAAEAAAADIRAAAKAEGERIRERARADAKQLHDQALVQLRAEVAGMVVLAASRVLGREVDAEQHRTLIERSLEEAGAQLSDGTA
jgi:F-type H+-transporting ATPase subunit b